MLNLCTDILICVHRRVQKYLSKVPLKGGPLLVSGPSVVRGFQWPNFSSHHNLRGFKE